MTKLSEKEVIRRKRIAEIKKDISGWIIMIPSLLLFTFFVWWPLILSIRLSFFYASGYSLTKFVGFKNFDLILNTPDFIPAVQNTFIYIGYSLLIGFLIPIIMAVLISEMVYFKGFFRIGSYFPNIVPGLATVVMWTFIFNPGKIGVLNIILSAFGIENQMWLADKAWTIPLIVITLTWKGAGATALIYLASLQGINQELYEAAAIDGAGIWNRIRYITVPNLYGVARTLLILQIISVFQILYEPMVMTNGGPGNASLSIMQLVYRFAFQDFNYPKAAAVSVVICIMLMGITFIYNNLIKKSDI